MKKLLSLGFVSLVCAAQGRYRLTWPELSNGLVRNRGEGMKGRYRLTWKGADGKERNKIVSVK